MKKLLLSLSIVVVSASAYAQTMSPFWNNKLNTMFPQTSMGAIYMDVVSQNVVWSIGNYGSNGHLSEFFTRTTNGGGLFLAGNVLPDTNSWFISSIDAIDANNCCGYTQKKLYLRNYRCDLPHRKRRR